MVIKVVYILGAGASYDAGGPLINDFFSRVGRYDKNIYPRHYDNNTKFNILESLYLEWKEDNPVNPNIEAFFQTVEFNTITGTKFFDPANNKSVDPEVIERYLVWYIASYVHHSITAQRKPPDYYLSFVRNLKKRGVRSTLLSFNYDLVIDKLIIKEFKDFNYGLGRIIGQRKYQKSAGIPFYKLHGSLNWLICNKCNRIYVYNDSEAHKYTRQSCTIKCGGYLEPYLIPPSPSKGGTLGPRNQLWGKARRKMKEGDKIVIIGYSLPLLDIQAKELLKFGAQSTKEIIIVNRNQRTIDHIASELGRIELGLSNYPMTFEKFVNWHM
jgi:NAD-dependent SIR2 family protein deacetylase